MTRIFQIPATTEAQAAMPALSFTVAPQQPGLAFNLVLSDPQQQRLLNAQAACQAWAGAVANVLTRSYTLSLTPTPGLGYDDRLTARTGCGKTKLYEALESGALEHQRLGNKYVVSEFAVLKWMHPLSYRDLLPLLTQAPGLESLEKAFAEQLKRAS